MEIVTADRLRTLPPYLFAEIDRVKQEVRARGVDLIDLGIGDPDLPTPDGIVDAMREAVGRPANHQYPSYEGMRAFREAAASFMRARFGVALDPETEVLALIGSKEGIAHIPLAFVNPGDVTLATTPGYPVYTVATFFAGGTTHLLPLTRANGYLPDLDDVPPDIARRATLFFLNYPNNPTAAVAPREFFEQVAACAARHGIIVCHDAAYTEVYFDGRRPPSFLEVPGAKEVGIEFHSLSKTFNMTGWRVGWACGNRRVLAALKQVKTNIDSGVFQAVQEAAIWALRQPPSFSDGMRATYQARRDIVVEALRASGLQVETPQATFYLWVAVPPGYTSAQFAAYLLEKSGIVVTPGTGFGAAGEGYVRMTITLDMARVAEVAERLRAVAPFASGAPGGLPSAAHRA